MKKLISFLAKKLNVSKSRIFWHFILLLALIGLAFISLTTFVILEIAACWGVVIVFLYHILDDDDDDMIRFGEQLWIYFTPIAWLGVILNLIAKVIVWIYRRTIALFNKSLNHEKGPCEDW